MNQMTIDSIWERYREDLDRAEARIREILRTVEPAIEAVGSHLLSSGGKRIRPFLAILSAKMLDGGGDDVSTLACSVEFIHSASLIHDDVVDGAEVRRGRPAAHSLWGNQVVVLVGDFLYANALRLANLLQRQRIMDALCTATAMMSEGELIQLSKKGSIDVTEDDYMKIIRGKTAILMSAACEGGAVLGNGTPEQVQALADFGLNFGYAFQIVDDILDYRADQQKLGKTLGKDLEEGKITLPLLYLLQEAEENERGQIAEIIHGDGLIETDLAYVQHILRRHGSIDKAMARARSLIESAKSSLGIFRDSFEKSALMTIADYVITREK